MVIFRLSGVMLGLFFHHEDGGDIFLKNVGLLPKNYTVLHPRRENSSFSVLLGYLKTRSMALIIQRRILLLLVNNKKKGKWTGCGRKRSWPSLRNYPEICLGRMQMFVRILIQFILIAIVTNRMVS
jgi:hypothetical protein